MNNHSPLRIFFRYGLFALISSAIAVTACSSAPKRPTEIFTIRNAAIDQLELANHAIMQKEDDVARQFLTEAWRLAVSTDDPDTRTRILLATGNAWFSSGKVTTAEGYWEQAVLEATEANLPMLAAAARVHLARGNLAEGQSLPEMSASDRVERAQESRRIVTENLPFLKESPLYSAFAWRVIGLAEKELKNTETAVDALSEAAKIHTSNEYLEEAAYDWYLTASVYSKASRYEEAIMALETAVSFDRRAENSAGLGQIWMAIGDVHNKAGNRDKARFAWTRSRDIFRAAFLMRHAQEADALLNQLEESL